MTQNNNASLLKPVDNTAPLARMDERHSARLGWWILLLGFGGFMIWALLAPLDEGATFPGSVTLVGSRKTVAHPYGGVIEKVLVAEGQQVKAGDVLVQLNTTKSDADLNTARAQWITISAALSRLVAERNASSAIRFPDWFVQNAGDPRVQESMRTQNELMRARQGALNADLNAMQESESALLKTLTAIEASTAQKQLQLNASQTQLDGLREMAAEGFMARNRVLEAERNHAAIMGSLADDQAQLARTRGQLGEVRMRMTQRRAEGQKEVQTQLAEVQRQKEELDNRLSSVQFDNSIAEVKSPVDGYVTGLQVFTDGGVVTPGMKLMDVVPTSDRMEIEGQLAVHLIDKVVPGLPVIITFPALNQRRTPTLFGRIRSVSADRLTDIHTGVPYYLVKVEIPPESHAQLEGQQVVPGMPADAFVKLGERTLMNYIVKPLTDRLRSSLTER